jgi:hypothetical protein
MKKAYIFIFSDLTIDKKKVRECLDGMSIILDWRTDMPNTYYLISEASAEEIATTIRNKIGQFRFLVTEYSLNSQGWLPDEDWYLLNNLKRKPTV